MVVFRTDNLPGKGNENFRRSLFLASLLKSHGPICFCSEGGKPEAESLKGHFSWKRPREIIKLSGEDVNGLLIDLERFSPPDLQLVDWANSHKIPSIQITALGLNQQNVTYHIDGSLDHMVAYGENSRGLFGPEYTILHHRFRHFHRIKRPYSRKIGRILVALGDGCGHRQIRDLVEGLVRHRFQPKILASSSLRRSHQKSLRSLYPSLRFVGRIDSLARPFFEADVALISADHRAYEAACCGTPALYFSFNDKQEFSAGIFSKKGLGQEAPSDWERNLTDLVGILSGLSRDTREKMGADAKKLVDGLGIYRVLSFVRDVFYK